MGHFAAGKRALAECDRCGQRYLLRELRKETVKGKVTDVKVCPQCFDPDHPQLFLGETPVVDPQALRDPRPETGVAESRDIQWGWAPVGGAAGPAADTTPNYLVLEVEVGDVTVEVA